MLHYDPYTLTTLLSATVILIMGVCLVAVSTPREPELRNYRIAKNLLAAAYIILGTVGHWEVFDGIESDNRALALAFALIAGSFQALLFTFSLISLINFRFITRRRLWRWTVSISLPSAALITILFCAPAGFRAAFAVASTLYCLQLAHHVAVFHREYRDYRKKLDDFFSEDEERRMNWVRHAFYMATAVGVCVLLSMPFGAAGHIAFIAAYTAFYIYYAVKYVNYVAEFYRIAPAIADPARGETQKGDISGEELQSLIGRWIARKGFLNPDITLESLSKELSTNRSYLSNHINSRYGRNFRSWVNSLRIAESQLLLSERSDLPVTEIGEIVGIPSSSSFFRQFHSVTGMTPAEYRRHADYARAKNG